jgi:HEAT repeat protein
VTSRYPEAIPYCREQLANAKTDDEKIVQAANLRALGAPDINAHIIGWLEDPDFKAKRMAINMLAEIKDPAALAAIRNYVDAEDEQLATDARCALLQLGDESAKGLLLQVLAKILLRDTTRSIH